MSNSEELRGIITRLFHQSPGFCAGKLRPVDGGKWEQSFAGKIFVSVGEVVTFVGEWIDHEKFGRQFQVSSRKAGATIDVNGLAAWLTMHGLARGIGPVKARKIAEEFGDSFTDVLRDNPEQIAISAGVPLENVKDLSASWLENIEMNAVATKLAAFGLTHHQIKTLYDKYKGSTVSVLESDPYLILGDVEGFGFARADDIATRLGVSLTAPSRVRVAVTHALGEASKDGSTCLSEPELVAAVTELLHVGAGETQCIADALEMFAAEQRGKVSVSSVNGKRFFALAWLSKAEDRVEKFLRSCSAANPFFPNMTDQDRARRLATVLTDGVNTSPLDTSQIEAVALALRHRGLLITGGAGSGKTTIIKALCHIYREHNLNIALCAPTGKAARRMRQVTGVEASTIHRLLEYHPTIGFGRNAENTLEQDVIVVDEASMLDIQLASTLFSAVGGQSAIVLVGDHHQLPSVGPGAVLRDCLDRRLIPTAVLTTCHRQAGPLKQNSHAVLNGNVAPTHEHGEVKAFSPWYVYDQASSAKDVAVLVERSLDGFSGFTLASGEKIDFLRDVQFMTPIHKGPIGTLTINSILQRLYQKQRYGIEVEDWLTAGKRAKLYTGDKVIQTKNDYSLGVMNGTVGIVQQDFPLIIDFDDIGAKAVAREQVGNIDLAYCLTPHKYQGSEIPVAVVICHSLHRFSLHRNWLYTAVTRAKDHLLLLGDRNGILHAAKTIKATERRTLLGLRVGVIAS